MNIQGLYTPSYEHDSCGVGMVVNIHGAKTHQLVDNALKVLENMEHRGAETRDKTGDGAGILLQIPHEFILLQGIPVPEKGRYGTGLVFLPKDPVRQQQILSVVIEEIERVGLNLMHLRNVPTNPDALGVGSREVEPDIKQVFVTGVKDEDLPNFDRILYKIRKKIENRIDDDDFYICSLSSKDIIYKGMLTSGQLRRYYPDLSNNYFTSGLALVHSRFSTNTFPKWKLAQPFRLLCHNGEINTIRGNRGWFQARESVLSSEILGDIREIKPILQKEMSDSASLDTLKSLDGKRVTITGYMATLSPLSGEYIYLMNMPYQSCPFCVPNTNQLSNTMAVYAASGSKFEFTDRPVQISGVMRVQDKVDDYGYSYNYYIDDASYTAVDLSSVSHGNTGFPTTEQGQGLNPHPH